MDKENAAPQPSPTSSLEFKKKKRKYKTKKARKNLKTPLKAKEKLIKCEVLEQTKDKENKTRKLVLENLSQSVQRENIFRNVLKDIKSDSNKLKSDNSKKNVQHDLLDKNKTSDDVSSSEEFSPRSKKSKKKEVTSKTKTANPTDLDNPNEHIMKALGSRSVDSIKTGEEIFRWLLNSIDLKTFFRVNWQKKPILIKRKYSSYYSYLLCSNDIDYVLRNEKLYFTKNIDVTPFDGTSFNALGMNTPVGQATAPLVWEFFANGFCIHLLNPQVFFPKIHAFNAALQEYFGCFVGANIYLTPPKAQDFGPRYDDHEVFVMQIEGAKIWKLYSPRNSRSSSKNFTEKDLGPPVEKVLLEAGDILYIPRGIIHQSAAEEDKHSLQITLSMFENTSWADFLQVLLPTALKYAINEDASFNKTLPMHYLSHLGSVHSDKTSKIRSKFLSNLESLMSKVLTFASVDATADQLGKRFIRDSLPPFLSTAERKRTIIEDGVRITKGELKGRAELCLNTAVKLIRYNCVRLVYEENTIRVYYSIANSKEYHAAQPQYIEIEEEFVPIISALINYYPNFITVKDMPPVDNDAAKITIVSDLWYRGIIMTAAPLTF